MQQKNTFIIGAVVIVAVAALGAIAYFALTPDKNDNTNSSGNVACTDEAKICPDGSVVVRTGADCEFAACPDENSSANSNTNTSTDNANTNTNSNTSPDITDWKTYTDTAQGYSVKYPATWTIAANGAQLMPPGAEDNPESGLIMYFKFAVDSIATANVENKKSLTINGVAATQQTETGAVNLINTYLPIGQQYLQVYWTETIDSPTYQQIIQTITLTKAATTPVAGQTTYTSTKLGVQFKHADTYGGKNLLVKEISDKIYLYQEGQEYTTGQYVQIWTKSDSVSLKSTIESKFLAGYSSTDCFVKEITSTSAPAGFKVETISYPAGNTNAEDPMANASKCPATYTTAGGISFFAVDPNHQTKYFFFSIGQYNLPADKADTPWQKTFEVL